MFLKAKDLMTVGNILGGTACALVAMEGMARVAAAPLEARHEVASMWVFWSAMMMLVAFFFDVFDGVVALALKQVNKFGGEFDSVADLVAYSVAPTFLLFLAYRHLAELPGIPDDSPWKTLIAGFVAVIPTVFGSIRFARFNVRKLEVDGFWIGFPRPASGLMMVALVNSELFRFPFMAWVGLVLVVVLGFMNLSLKPWIGHHGRRFTWYLGSILHVVWMTVVFSLLGGVVLGWFGIRFLPPQLVFDWILIWMSCYLLFQWADVPKAARMAVRKLTAEWND